MSDALAAAIVAIDRAEPAILVEVTDALGSTPREAGTLMLVTETAIAGTIGGGELEWRAIERAREALAGEAVPERLQLPLGPALQQCCGGHVTLALRQLSPIDRERLSRAPRNVAHGAPADRPLRRRPCRPGPGPGTRHRCPAASAGSTAGPGLFPASLAATIDAETIPDPAAITTDPTDLVLVMTHSHALDLAIVEARLKAMDFAWLGLIGSATKRRRFERQLRAGGIPAERLERLVCPIGLAVHPRQGAGRHRGLGHRPTAHRHAKRSEGAKPCRTSPDEGPPMNAPPRLQLTGIRKAYPGVLANDDVDLTVGQGEIHALLGENGAGKSTLVKIIYGVLAPDAGQISWEGRPVTIASPHAARHLGIGMVFQHFSLFEALSVLENVALGLRRGERAQGPRQRGSSTSATPTACRSTPSARCTSSRSASASGSRSSAACCRTPGS